MKKTRSGSFASKLSRRIVHITSMVFLLAIAVISYTGGRMSSRESLNYSAQVLQSSIFKLENTFKAVEMVSGEITETIETVRSIDARLDTANYFKYLTETICDCPYVLGAGVFYNPYKYDSKEQRAGIYVGRDSKTGKSFNEWHDNKSLEKDDWDYFGAKWFIKAHESGHNIWIPPFCEYSSGREYAFMSAYASPIRDDNGEIIAVCDIDMSLEWLQSELLGMRPYPESNVILLDSLGKYICNPLSETPYEGSINNDRTLSGIILMEQSQADNGWETRSDGFKTTRFKYNGTHMFCIKGELSNGWQMLIVNKYADTFQSLHSILALIGIIAILGLVLLFFVCFRIVHNETVPISQFAEAAGKITDGHFDVPIPEIHSDDEISELGSALSYMQTSVTRYIEELKQTTAEKERMAGELDIARNIQMQMLSSEFPAFEEGGIFASSKPARQVGGDLYDFRLKGDRLFYIVADVSGKGVPAAMLMSISIAAFRAAIRNEHTPDEIVSIINHVFCRCNNDNMFITVNTGYIDIKTGEMYVCNAGHNPMVLITPEGEASYMQLNNNLVCGVMPEFDFKCDKMMLAKDSRLIIYTDGVTEAEDCDHGQYGEDRLLQFAKAHSKSAVANDAQVIADLSAAVDTFVSGAEQFDDITMMSISI